MAATFLRSVSLGLLAFCLAAPAWSQYKIVGPDGKVTYSDQPVAGATGSRVVPGESPSPISQLPIELRQAVGKYPVTLVTRPDCGPCDAGRQLLVRRGVPYTEKRVETDADVAALRRLSGALNLPLLTIGSQQLKGLTTADWNGYLDCRRLSARVQAAGTLAQPHTQQPRAQRGSTERATARG